MLSRAGHLKISWLQVQQMSVLGTLSGQESVWQQGKGVAKSWGGPVTPGGPSPSMALHQVTTNAVSDARLLHLVLPPFCGE